MFAIAVAVRRFAIIVSLVLVSAFAIAPNADAARDSIQLKAIGRPTWKPVDCHLFAAPIGTPASEYAEYSETLASLLPPPRHVPIPALGIGPGRPHRPPYNSEWAKGLEAQRYHEGRRFRPREFSNGQGVFLVCMVVPRPGTWGSSPDFRFGPIIPNRLFPIAVEGAAYRNGEVFDEAFDFEVPPLTPAIAPRFNVDGHSHFPVSLVTNLSFWPADAPPISARGSYRYQVTLIDSVGKGWRLSADFAVRR